MPNGTDKVEKLLGRIRFRRRLRAVIQHFGTSVATAVTLMALLVLLERLFFVASSDLVFYGLPLGLFFISVLASFLSVRNSPIAEAVEAEKSERIPQTISSSLFVDGFGFGEEAAAKIRTDSQLLAGKIDLSRAIPLGKPGQMVRTIYALILLGMVFTVPNLDLLGTQEEVNKKQREKDRIARKEGSLQRRLNEVSRIAVQHQIDPETRKLLVKLAKKPPQLPAVSSTRKTADLEAAQERAQKARKDVASRIERGSLESARNTAEKVRRSAEQDGGLKSKAGNDLEQAIRKGDLGRAALELEKLAELAKKSGAEGDKAREDLSQLAESMDLPDSLSSKFSKENEAGEAGGSFDPDDLERLARNMEELARLLKESELLDHALDQIQFTEAELSALPSDWPEGPPPQICPDCLSGT